MKGIIIVDGAPAFYTMTIVDWPFGEPKNVAVYTLVDILEQRASILLVSRDETDGNWRFSNYAEEPSTMTWRLVALSTIVAIDSTVKELANLPAGYSAIRTSPDAKWQQWKQSGT